MIRWSADDLGHFEDSPQMERRPNFELMETDRGTGIKRLVYDGAIWDVRARYVMKSPAQRNLFWAFYNVTLRQGVEDFVYPNPLTGLDATWTFLKAPSVQPMGGAGQGGSPVVMATLSLRMQE